MTPAGLARWAGAAMLVLLLAAAQAWAQEVRLRSGEHPGFTRLVVDFTDRPDWQLGRAGAGYELRTGRDGLRYDLSAAFRRIRRDRLAGLEDLGSGRLGLRLACRCRLTTEELPGGGLVIDIRDGAPRPGDPHERPLPPLASGPQATAPPEAPSPAEPPAPPLPRPSARPSEEPPTPEASPADGPGPKTLALPGGTAPAPLLPGALTEAASDPEAAARRARAEEMRAHLAEQLARAAAQGLVDPRSPLAGARPEPAPPPAPPDPEEPDTSLPLSQRPNVRIETQVDLDLGPHRRSAAAALQDACLPPELLDPAGWGPEDPALTPVGPLRAALVSPTGAPVPGAYARLARAYLYMSFGAEARQVLAEAPADTPDLAELRVLAAVMDGAPAGPALADQLDCPGAPALWAVLSLPELPAEVPVNRKAVTAAFSALPLHLRRHLGPQLVRRFLRAGDMDTARRLENALRRAAPPSGPEDLLVSAEMDLQAGHRDRAETRLGQVAASRSEEASEAVIRLIDTRVEAGAEAGLDLTDTAAALAHDVAGTRTDARLRAAELRGLIGDGRFGRALDRLARSPGPDRPPPENRPGLVDALLLGIASRSDDVEFLPLAVRAIGLRPDRGPGRTAMARRLAQFGLSDLARQALNLGEALPDREEREVLARVALAEARPQVALGYLAGLHSAEAEAMRTEAEAVLAGPPPLPEAAAGAPAPDATPPDWLAGDRGLLQDSRAIRDQVTQLLGQVPQN